MEGTTEADGVFEGAMEGTIDADGVTEGAMERTPEADGVTDGAMDGAGLGVGGLLGCALVCSWAHFQSRKKNSFNLNAARHWASTSIDVSSISFPLTSRRSRDISFPGSANDRKNVHKSADHSLEMLTFKSCNFVWFRTSRARRGPAANSSDSVKSLPDRSRELIFKSALASSWGPVRVMTSSARHKL